MTKPKIILTTGLAMFAMFFGSGNLVFPLKLGIVTNEQYLTSTLGFIITGVMLPFLGLFSMMLYDGDRRKYFGLLGKRSAFMLTMLMLLLMGPGGVVPRCIIVAYGGITALYPNLPLWMFSLFFSAVMLLVIWDKNGIVPIIGKYLGPFKIGVILVIIAAGLIFAPEFKAHDDIISNPFTMGLFEGYQTMDLPAAFFFSVTIVEYLRRAVPDKNDVLKIGILSGCVGASLIAAIYMCFTTIGAHYAQELQGLNPEQYLATVAQMTLGKSAALIFALTMFLACLTTASTLCTLFGEFLHHDISGERISWKHSILITVGMSFLLSLTGFGTIAFVLGTILTYIYPALVVLTISALLKKYYNFGGTKYAFWGTIGVVVLIKLV